MKHKSILYKKEQEEIESKIKEMLELDDEHSITLYEIDQKKSDIMDMLVDIRKYFSFAQMEGARDPEKMKRPHLSIIKYIMKKNHHIYNTIASLKLDDGQKIRTMRYVFIEK